jgi:dTDP-4-dehydrorhamnose 3,5-epimerase-like enzyme
LWFWSKDDPQIQWHYLSERNANDGALYIPTGLWHGCFNYTNEPAILIYHITTKYNGTDEDRLDPKLAMWDYERVNH